MAKVKELKEEQNEEKPVLHGILEEFRTDIELEIKNTNNNKILLECGRVMPQIDSNFRYQFKIEYIPNILGKAFPDFVNKGLYIVISF